MAIIRFGEFKGQLPIVHPALLPVVNAQVAKNMRNDTGALRPIRGQTTIQATTTATPPTSIYRYYNTNTWLEWTSDVNAVGSLIPNDQYKRVYYTGDAYPKFTTTSDVTNGTAPYPAVSYRLGLPSPSAPTATIAGSATDPNDVPETRYYVVTYVDAYGSEGPPSLPSSEVIWRPGQTVDLSALAIAPSGNYNVTNKRIYRINTGTSGSVYQFVAELPIATTTYNDAISPSSLGEALQTTSYDPPPDDTMKGLVALPGEYMAAYYSNVVCFSEPGQPHAWPLEYQLTTDSDITGIGAFGNSLLVTTERNPYYITGIHPGSTSMTKLEMSQACVSKRSVVDMGSDIVYASPDGLVQVGTGGARLLTEGVFNREEWQKLKPSTISGYYWEGMYLGFYDDGTTKGGFSISPNSPDNGVVFFDTYATAGYSDLQTDLLYLVVGNNIVSWDSDNTAASLGSYTWRSKKIQLPLHDNFGVIQILADSYPVGFEVFADNNSVFKSSAVSSNPVFLPSGYLAREYYVEITGSKDVYDIVLATTIEELKRV